MIKAWLIKTCMLSKYTYFGKNTHIQTHTHKHEIHVHTHTQAHRAVTDTLKSTKHQHICTNKPKHSHTHTYSIGNEHTKTQTNTSTVVTICARTKRTHMVTHGLLGAYRGSMAQGSGEIGCEGAQKVTGGIFGHAWSRRATAEKKATQQIGPRRHPKHHQRHSKKYNSANQYIIKLSTPKEPHQTRKNPSSTTKQHSKKHNSKTAKPANKLNVVKKNIKRQEKHRGKTQGPKNNIY